MKKYNKGFTLIELLVVIAIIGILASIVLVSLNTARQKGKDASASGSISSFRGQAEIAFDTAGDYSGVCTSGVNLLNAASVQAGGPAVWNGTGTVKVFCNPTTTAYAASVILLSGATATTEFCVDSTGFAGKRATPLGTATACPTS